MTTKKFFVYGTLKEGGHFATDFDGVRLGSEVAKLDGYNLFKLGWFPGIVPGDGEVTGELHEYEDPDKTQKTMDAIESYFPDNEKESLYLRREVAVTTETGETITAIAYIFNGDMNAFGKAKKVEGGVWDLAKYAR